MPATDLPPATGTGVPEPLLRGLHYAEGVSSLPPFFSFPRTMAILSSRPGCDRAGGNELVLVNAVRMDDSGERALNELGKVVAVVRIGMHDLDTRYYREAFGAEVYGYTSVEYAGALVPDHDLATGALPPVPGLSLIRFPHLPPSHAECALHLANGALITCDSVQSHTVSRGNLMTRVIMPWMGFYGDAVVGPMWLKLFVTEKGVDKSELGRDLSHLADLQFDCLVSGHGVLGRGKGAKDAVAAAIKKAFAN